MRYAVIDVETTGLFLFKDPVTGVPIPADDPRQPRLAHLAIILIDENLQEERTIDLYVRPDGWSMPQGEGSAGEVNGLTDEFLLENGAPIRVVLDRYLQVLDEGYVMVAYNAQHDLKQLRGELRRAGLPDRFEDTPNICAMRACTPLRIPKANGKGGAPQLSDACAYFGVVLTDAHTAGGDARACLEVFRHLHARGALPDARVHYAKVPPLAPTLAEPMPVHAIPERF